MRRDLRFVAVAGALVLTLSAGLVRPVAAQDADERARPKEAAQVLRAVTDGTDRGIPALLFQRAQAVAVIPNVLRAALGVGGRRGKGVAVVRDAKGAWGPATFLELTGASIGFQIGGDQSDVILFFIAKDGLEKLLEDRVQLGGNVSVAAGPVGRSAEAGTNLTLDEPIYAYSRSKGAFAGVALDGTVISIDDSANKNAFGREPKRQELLGGSLPTPDIFAPFVAAVRELTPAAAR